MKRFVPNHKTSSKSSFLYWTFFLILLSTSYFLDSGFVSASTTDGTIASTDKYAWSSSAGWINFAPTNGNIHITDSALTGYAWSDLYGWINMNPTGGGVLNTSAGALSGHAWGEKLGWINFAGVTISSAGTFTGTATGTNIGTLTFDCDNCSVVTDWRPAANRAGAVVVTPAPVSGGAFPPGYIYSPPVPEPLPTTEQIYPATTTAIATPTPKVRPVPVVKPPIIVQPPIEVTEKPPSIIGAIIEKLTTLIKQLPPQVPEILIPSIPIAKFVDGLGKFLPNLFRDQPPLPDIPIETFVSREAPPALAGVWNRIDTRDIGQFVFAPLPKEFLALQKNFPAIGNLFSKVGVEKLSDLSKLQTTELRLPGLAEAGQNNNTKIPPNIIFASVANRLVDFKIALSLSKKGQPVQKITTVSGKPLHLTIRPDHPVKMVKGYLIFRSRTPQIRAEIDFTQMLSAFFAEPVFAYPLDQPVPTEEKFVLQEFEYTDPDGDGTYTADIQSPISSGEYEIITVMDYEDPDLGSKQVRLITVVDPEGYVYEKVGGNEMRLPNASVTLYYLDPATNKYIEWPGQDFSQENPQVTDVRGTYSFLVPVGTYYLTAIAPGYPAYQSEPFIVQEGSGVHMNIELKSRYGLLRNIDWKTALLIIVAILLLINFYKDKKNAKLPN